MMLTRLRCRVADWRWQRAMRVPPGVPTYDEAVAEAEVEAERRRVEVARRVARERAMPRPARTVRIVDTSGRTLRLVYLRPRRGVRPMSPDLARRRREARPRHRHTHRRQGVSSRGDPDPSDPETQNALAPVGPERSEHPQKGRYRYVHVTAW